MAPRATLAIFVLGSIACALATHTTFRNVRWPAGDHVFWNRTLSENVTVREFAIVSSEANVVILVSHDNASVDLGYSQSINYFHFAEESTVQVVAVARYRNQNHYSCFITTSMATDFERFKQAILDRNNTVQDLPPHIVELDLFQVRRRPMSRHAGNIFKRANRFSDYTLCPSSRFVDLRESGETNSNIARHGSSQVLKVLSSSSVIEITVPERIDIFRYNGRSGRMRTGGRGGYSRHSGRSRHGGSGGHSRHSGRSRHGGSSGRGGHNGRGRHSGHGGNSHRSQHERRGHSGSSSHGPHQRYRGQGGRSHRGGYSRHSGRSRSSHRGYSGRGHNRGGYGRGYGRQ